MVFRYRLTFLFLVVSERGVEMRRRGVSENGGVDRCLQYFCRENEGRKTTWGNQA
jgi:hypothetical protein